MVKVPLSIFVNYDLENLVMFLLISKFIYNNLNNASIKYILLNF